MTMMKMMQVVKDSVLNRTRPLNYTVDGIRKVWRLHQLRLVVYPILYKVLYRPGGCLGFLPGTVAKQSFFEHRSKIIGDWGTLNKKELLLSGSQNLGEQKRYQDGTVEKQR